MNGLEGRRIVVTRAAAQADGLVAALEAASAEVIRAPTIRIAPPDSWSALDAAVERLDEYRWIAFTSRNGVRFFAARLAELGVDVADVPADRVAAVGSGTAGRLAAAGLPCAFVPDEQNAAGLAASLPDLEGAAVLLPRSDRSDPAVAEVLLTRGAARVDDVPAYRTILVAPEADALEELRRGVDGITFTSPSTVDGFLSAGPEWRRFLDETVVVTLGPSTTRAARERGLSVTLEASDMSMQGLVDALRTALSIESRGGADE